MVTFVFAESPIIEVDNAWPLIIKVEIYKQFIMMQTSMFQVWEVIMIIYI